MALYNVKYKAEGSTEVPVTTGPTTAEALEMKKKLETAISEAEGTEKYDQYFAPEVKAERVADIDVLKRKLTNIEYFLQTGDWEPTSSASASTTADGQIIYDFTNLGAGWYSADPDSPSTPVGATIVDADANSGYPTGTKVVKVDNNSIPGSPTPVWLVADAKTKSITGETRGNDVFVTVTFTDGRKDEHYAIKDAAKRPDIQIGVTATKCDEGVTIDFQRTMIIDRLTGKKGGGFFIGSKNADNIFGTEGTDEIDGAGGNDTIDGMGNDADSGDNIYGYASDQVKAIYGEANLGVDGDDNIVDSFATNNSNADSINGGAGYDTLYRSKKVTAGTPQMEDTDHDLPPADWSGEAAGWFAASGTGWTQDPASTDKELVLQGTNDTPLKMEIPDGYIVSASKDGNDLVFNIIKGSTDASPLPTEFSVRAKNYYNYKNVSIDATGSFIDFSGVNVGANSVSLTGHDNESDVLVGPKTIFEEYGVKASELGSGNMTTDNVDQLVHSLNSTYAGKKPWSTATAVNGEIDVDGSSLTAIDVLNIPPELGAAAFITEDPANPGDLLITMVQNSTIDATKVVIRITGLQDKAAFAKNIKLAGMSSFVYNLTGSNNPGVTINGLSGTDFIAGYKYGTIFDPSETDEGIEINVPIMTAHGAAETPDATYLDTMLDEISKLLDAGEYNDDTCFSQLTKYETEAGQYTKDSDEYKKMWKAINDKRSEFISGKIAEYKTVAELTEKKTVLMAEIAKLKNADHPASDADNLTQDLADKETELKADEAAANP